MFRVLLFFFPGLGLPKRARFLSSCVRAEELQRKRNARTTDRKRMAIAAETKKEDDEISLADSDDMGVDDDAAFALPPTKIEIDPNTGIKTVTEYRVKEDGSRVRSIKRVKVHKVTKTVTKEMLERKNWARFGDAARYKPGDESMTAVSLEEIFLERARLQPKSELEKANDPLKAMATSQTSLLVCRICGKKGDHWTTKCPYKDLAAMGDKPPGSDGPGGDKAGGSAGYVPPSKRAGASASEGDSMNRRREENSVRVSNLSEDTREQDLQELFRPFGPVTRIYVAFNRETGESRGFAFVNFVNRDDGQRAIDRLDGFGYDNLILRVEWSAPREERR